MEGIDEKLFSNLSFSQLSAKIYNRSKRRELVVDSIIGKLDGLIKTPSDATFIVPLLKDLLDSDVKNSDIQIKIATLYQKLITMKERQSSNSDIYELSEEEKKELESLAKNYNLLEEKNDELEDDIKDLEENVYPKIMEELEDDESEDNLDE